MATNRNEPWAECEIDESKKELIQCSVYEVKSLPKCPFSYWEIFDDKVEIADLKDKQFEFIIKEDNESLVFIGLDCIYIMAHIQDCCESVRIDDICGDLEDLIGSPIRIAEELHSDKILPAKDEWDESFTWTFYKFATSKGYVDIKWYGTSNGYYSESVDLFKIDEEKFPHVRAYYMQQLQKLQTP